MDADPPAQGVKIARRTTPDDRERWRERAEEQGLSAAALTRQLIKRELREPVAA